MAAKEEKVEEEDEQATIAWIGHGDVGGEEAGHGEVG